MTAPPREGYCLRLYIAGPSTRSTRAIEAIKRLCERVLKEEYELEVIDLLQQPERAAPAQIVAAPTLVKERPAPPRRLWGTCPITGAWMAGLGLSMEG
jgi:circadian clock protein KaiB